MVIEEALDRLEEVIPEAELRIIRLKIVRIEPRKVKDVAHLVVEQRKVLLVSFDNVSDQLVLPL